MNTQYVAINKFGHSKNIRLTAREAGALIPLLADCRECEYWPAPWDEAESNSSYDPDICYVVTLQSGPRMKLFDPTVTFTSSRHLLDARCLHPGTERAIRRVLDGYMDDLDRLAADENRDEKPVY